MLNRPSLIQRCKFEGNKLMYDYMGSAEFEWGGQSQSLKKIFAAGMLTIKGCVVVNRLQTPVFMIATSAFGYREYEPYLQMMADGTLRGLQEPTYFDYAIDPEKTKRILGTSAGSEHYRVDVWFDIENDVLWTLTRENHAKLIAELEGLKLAWSAKAALNK